MGIFDDWLIPDFLEDFVGDIDFYLDPADSPLWPFGGGGDDDDKEDTTPGASERAAIREGMNVYQAVDRALATYGYTRNSPELANAGVTADGLFAAAKRIYDNSNKNTDETTSTLIGMLHTKDPTVFKTSQEQVLNLLGTGRPDEATEPGPDPEVDKALDEALLGQDASLRRLIISRLPGYDEAGAQSLIDYHRDPLNESPLTDLMSQLRLWPQDEVEEEIAVGGIVTKNYAYKVGPGGEVFAWDPATGTINSVGTYPALADAINYQFITDATTGMLYAVDPANPTEFIELGKRGFAEIDPERDFAEGIRRFDNNIKETARQFNTTEERIRAQFGATFREDQRQFDLGLSENQRQFGITEGRLLRKDIGQLGLGLGQLSQQEAEYARQVMRDPADFLSRAFATRGEVSPLDEVTQADLINSLRTAFADIGRFTDEQITASQARLVAPALAEIERPALTGTGFDPAKFTPFKDVFTAAPPPPPPPPVAEDPDIKVDPVEDKPTSTVNEPSINININTNGNGNGNGDDSLTPLREGYTEDELASRLYVPPTSGGSGYDPKPEPPPRLVSAGPGQPVRPPASSIVVPPLPQDVLPDPFDPRSPNYNPDLLQLEKGGRLRNPAYQDGGRMNAGVGIVGDSSDGKENRELFLLDPGSSATIIPEDQLPKDALRGRLKIRGYQTGGEADFVPPPGGFRPENEIPWGSLGAPTMPSGTWARHPDDPRQFGMNSFDPKTGQSTIHQTRVNTPAEKAAIEQQQITAWGGPEAAARLGQIGPGVYGDPTSPHALRRYQMMKYGPHAQQKDIDFKLMVDPNDPTRFIEVPLEPGETPPTDAVADEVPFVDPLGLPGAAGAFFDQKFSVSERHNSAWSQNIDPQTGQPFQLFQSPTTGRWHNKYQLNNLAKLQPDQLLAEGFGFAGQTTDWNEVFARPRIVQERPEARLEPDKPDRPQEPDPDRPDEPDEPDSVRIPVSQITGFPVGGQEQAVASLSDPALERVPGGAATPAKLHALKSLWDADPLAATAPGGFDRLGLQRLAETRPETPPVGSVQPGVDFLEKGGRLRNIPRYQEGGPTANPYATMPVAPPTSITGMTSGLFENLPTEGIEQADLLETARRYQPPAVRDLLAGKRPQFLEPGGRTGQRLFSPQQLGRLTPDEQSALRTRLAAQNLSLDDFLFAQRQRYVNPRQQGRGRLVFQ